MRITILLDNKTQRDDFRVEHGLSFLVETKNGSVLFDTGQSSAWFDNLNSLGKDPKEIVAVAISHGHYDHTGGLVRAFQELPDANFYAHPRCFEEKYSTSGTEKRYIGMPEQAIFLEDRFVLNSKAVEILPGVLLSGKIRLIKPVNFSRRFSVGNNGFQLDTFEDEQCLILKNGEKTAALVGCAHRDVENNVLAAMEVAGVDSIDLLVGGFHLSGTSEERLDSLANFLEKRDIKHTACCHCTGIDSCEHLVQKLGNRVEHCSGGVFWEL